MNSHSSHSTSPCDRCSNTLIIFVAFFWTQSIFPFPFHTGKTSTGLGTSTVSHQWGVERKELSLLAAPFPLQFRRLISFLQGCLSGSWLICYPPGLPVLSLKSCFLVVRPKSVWVQWGYSFSLLYKLFLSLQPSTILILLKICNHLKAEINNAMLNSILYSHKYNFSFCQLAFGNRSYSTKTLLVKEHVILVN